MNFLPSSSFRLTRLLSPDGRMRYCVDLIKYEDNVKGNYMLILGIIIGIVIGFWTAVFLVMADDIKAIRYLVKKRQQLLTKFPNKSGAGEIITIDPELFRKQEQEEIEKKLYE